MFRLYSKTAVGGIVDRQHLHSRSDLNAPPTAETVSKKIPPTAVGGFLIRSLEGGRRPLRRAPRVSRFRRIFRLSMNNPPTAVGGILLFDTISAVGGWFRSSLQKAWQKLPGALAANNHCVITQSSVAASAKSSLGSSLVDRTWTIHPLPWVGFSLFVQSRDR